MSVDMTGIFVQSLGPNLCPSRKGSTWTAAPCSSKQKSESIFTVMVLGAKSQNVTIFKYVLILPLFRFALVQKHTVEFNQVAMANSEGSEVMLNRVMTKDNIGVAVLLEVKKELFAGGKHVTYGPFAVL